MRKVVNTLEINFDKLLSDYIEKLRKNNPDSEDDPSVGFNRRSAELAAGVCVSILKEYEALKIK